MKTITLPVDFGGVSIGETTARLGIQVDRGNLDLMTADEVFVGHRLTGKVRLGQRGDDPNQQKLDGFDDVDVEVEATFDVKRIGVNADRISTGLTFNLEDIDVSTLAQFSKGCGELFVESVAEIPDDKKDEDQDLMNQVTISSEPPGTLRAEGAWREHPLADVFEAKFVRSMLKAGLTTVGDLADYTASEKRLIDLDGVGPAGAARIENRMVQFWADNPDAE